MAAYYTVIAAGAAQLAADRATPEDVEHLQRVVHATDLDDEAACRRGEGTFRLEVAALSQSARLVREELRLQSEFAPLLWLCLRDAEYRRRKSRRAHAPWWMPSPQWTAGPHGARPRTISARRPSGCSRPRPHWRRQDDTCQPIRGRRLRGRGRGAPSPAMFRQIEQWRARLEALCRAATACSSQRMSTSSWRSYSPAARTRRRAHHRRRIRRDPGIPRRHRAGTWHGGSVTPTRSALARRPVGAAARSDRGSTAESFRDYTDLEWWRVPAARASRTSPARTSTTCAPTTTPSPSPCPCCTATG